jgi:hypothetical protein
MREEDYVPNLDLADRILAAGFSRREWIPVSVKPALETDTCSWPLNFYDRDGAVYTGYAQFDADGEVSWYSYENRCYVDGILGYQPLPSPPTNPAQREGS